MLENAGQWNTQYNVAEICATAFIKTATVDKAINGFRATGLWPFNNDIFTDEDFTAVILTEEEPPNATNSDMNTQVCLDSKEDSDNPNENQVVSDVNTNTGTVSFHYPSIFQPEGPQPGTSMESEAKRVLKGFCSLPKPAENQVRERKIQKSEIITSSPYKKKPLDKEKSTPVAIKMTISKKSKKIPSPISSDDEEWPHLVYQEPFAGSRPLLKMGAVHIM